MFTDREGYNQPAYKAWRYAVFTRDRFKCALCPNVGGNLEAHHIVKWAIAPHLRYAVSNGITLCKDCHDIVNHNEEKYEDQFKRIVALRKIQNIKRKTNKKIGRPKGSKNSKLRKRKYRLNNPRLRF